MRDSARRADAHRKIQLGGLIIKAGLDGEAEAVLLGALIRVAAMLAGPDAAVVRERWRRAGGRAFLDAAEKKESAGAE